MTVLDLSATVQREGDRVWIDVPGFDAGMFASSVHGSQARILEHVGESMTYADLVCYSGFAFRAAIDDRLCPSAGHPACGYGCIGSGFRAVPWRLEGFMQFPWGEPAADQAAFRARARAAVKASIDRGVPVHYGSEEDGLIVGYGADGERWLCMHPYYKRGRELVWFDEAEGFAGGGEAGWPWSISVWVEPKPADERVDRRALLVAALRQAVAMHHSTEKHGEHYLSGEAAYAFWIDWLEGIDAGTVEDAKLGMQGNGWCFDVLLHCRRIAGPWLREQAEGLEAVGGDDAAADALRDAAGAYDELVAVVGAGLSDPWKLAPGPGEFEGWTREMRVDQIRRLKAARAADGRAIEAIGRALVLLGDEDGGDGVK